MATNTKNIILFDMDNTLLTADSIELWSHFLDQKGLVTAQDKIHWGKFHQDYIDGCLDYVASYEFEISMIKRIPLNLRQPWLEEFFTQKLKDKMSNSGLQLIQEYKKLSDTLVILITATLSYISKKVAEYAQVHDYIATEGEILDGEYTGRLFGTPSIGEGKLQRYLEWLKLNNIQAKSAILYSDSINDLPLLSYVEKPIVVDPDHQLKTIALQRNWDIISLRNDQTQIIEPLHLS